MIIAYIPVLHKGYLQFLQKYADAQVLYLVGEDLLAEFDQMRKDIRRLEPEQVKKMLVALGLPFQIEILTKDTISDLESTSEPIIMPDEDIMRELAEAYFSGKQIEFNSTFLRWDRPRSLNEVAIEGGQKVSQAEFDREMMAQAQAQTPKSSDWWRQVGGVVVKDGQLLFEAFNQHVPHEHVVHFDGDPRGNFHKGEHLDKSTALHVEQSLVAQAAQSGTSLAGASIYVTTFPCPSCAKLIAYSGIKKLYFQDGYAVVDGERILEARGVEIIRVSPDPSQS
jgi:dCMP deaminase